MAFTLDYAIVIVYLLVILIVGYFRGRGEHLLDFTVNRRRTSTLFLTASTLSTAFGVGSLLGIAAEAQRTGISFGISAFFAIVLSFAVMIWMGPKIKKFGDSHQAQTIADFFAERYSMSASTLTSLLTIAAFLLSTSVQFIGIASLASVLIGVSWEVALIVAAIVTVAYTSFGGLRNDIATDFVQFIVILVMFFIMVPLGFLKVGGLSSFATLPASSFDPFAYGGAVFFFGSIILGSLLGVTQMDIWQRTYSAQSEKTVRRAYLYSLLISAPMYILTIVFGLWAKYLFPNIMPEQGFFTFMSEILPTGLLGIGFAGILAAAMSSIDSCIVVGSTSFTNDIYAKFIRKQAHEHLLLRRTRLFAVLFSAVALIIAYFVPNIVKLVILANLLLLNFMPAIFGGFFWKRANAKAALWSLILSTITLLVGWFTIGVNAWLPAFFVSTLVFVIGSFFGKQKR